MDKASYAIDLKDITPKDKLGENDHFVTFISSLFVDSFKCVSKFIKSNKNKENFEKYISILQANKHPGIIPFVGFSKSTEKNKDNAFFLKLAPNYSLQYVFNLRSKGKIPKWWTIARQYLFIYGIAKTMEYLHSKDIIHQRLTPSNILIDENIEPQITDFKLSNHIYDFDFSDEKLIKDNLIYHIDPYVLRLKSEFQKSSDVFSFGIILLQILSNSTEIYHHYDDKAKLLANIKKKERPIIPDFKPDKMKKLLNKCLSQEPSDRPSFSKICIELEKIYKSMEHFDVKKLNDYKNKIETADKSSHEELISPVLDMKTKALSNDVDMMYLYAKERSVGKNCAKNIIEAVKYFRMAAENGHPTAKEQLELMLSTINNTDEKPNDNDEKSDEPNDKTKTNTDYNKKIRVMLADDLSYDEEKVNITRIIKNIDQEIKVEEKFNFSKNEIKKQNFIFTKGAEERLQKLIDYIQVGVPVLLEGPTGTSKTLSSEIVCKSLNYELIRFNLSSETKTQIYLDDMLAMINRGLELR